MRALATLVLGIILLWVGREALNAQFNHVKNEVEDPSGDAIPEMKPAYDAEAFKDFDSSRVTIKPVTMGGGSSSSAYSEASEPTTDLSSYED